MGGGHLTLHISISQEVLRFLQKRGLLKKFFEEYRKTSRSDGTGIKALESVLKEKLDAIEKQWEAHIQTLSWVDSDHFRERATALFEAEILIRTDDELLMAIAGPVAEAEISECLKDVKRLRVPLMEVLGIKPSCLPLIVYFFKDASQFEKHVRAYSTDQKEVGIGGLYMPEQRTVLLYATGKTQTFTHEYLHSVLHDDLGRFLPSWLDEGLASLFEDFVLDQGTVTATAGSTLKEVRVALKEGKLPKFSNFLNPKWEGWWHKDNIHLHYQLARAFWLYLQAKGWWVNFYKKLREVRAANPAADLTCTTTLQQVLGMKVDDIGRDFLEWLASSAPKD